MVTHEFGLLQFFETSLSWMVWELSEAPASWTRRDRFRPPTPGSYPNHPPVSNDSPPDWSLEERTWRTPFQRVGEYLGCFFLDPLSNDRPTVETHHLVRTTTQPEDRGWAGGGRLRRNPHVQWLISTDLNLKFEGKNAHLNPLTRRNPPTSLSVTLRKFCPGN